MLKRLAMVSFDRYNGFAKVADRWWKGAGENPLASKRLCVRRLRTPGLEGFHGQARQ